MNIKNDLKKIIEFIHFHQNNNKKDIFIFSTPRSGTSLLGELIITQPKIKFIAEPLNKNVNNNFYYEYLIKYFQSNITNRWIKLSESKKKHMYNYINDLSNSKILGGRKYHFYSHFNDLITHSFITDRSVFKILSANPLINWFENEFNIDIILLFRHPIPTCLSQIRNNWNINIELYMNSIVYKRSYLNQEIIDFINFKNYNSSKLEKFVINWCLDMLPLKNYIENNKNYILLTYEDLIINTKKAINFLGDNLDLNKKKRMYKRIQQPSISSNKSTDKTVNNIMKKNKKHLINKWKNSVSYEEEKNVFEILEKFDIDIYELNNFMPKKDYII